MGGLLIPSGPAGIKCIDPVLLLLDVRTSTPFCDVNEHKSMNHSMYIVILNTLAGSPIS